MIRVVAGLHSHRQNRAGARVEHDRACALGAPLADRLTQHFLSVRLNAVVEGEVHVASRNLRALAMDVDHLSTWVLDDGLLAGAAREHAVELKLQARQPAAVGSDEAEDLRGHRSLWVVATLLWIEAEAGKLQPLQGGSARRVGLTCDIDEAVRTVREAREDQIGRASCRER